MGQSHWRHRAKPIIARVLWETEGRSDKEIQAALLEAYPFGPKAFHPYKIWRDEIARQTGKKPPLGTRTRKAPEADPRQTELFDD